MEFQLIAETFSISKLAANKKIDSNRFRSADFAFCKIFDKNL